MENGLLQEAVLAFEAAVQQEPDNAEAWRYVLNVWIVSALCIFTSCILFILFSPYHIDSSTLQSQSM